MSHFGRHLNQSGDGLPRRFEMLPYLFIGCVIGCDNYVSSSIIINYQLSWGYNLGFQLTANRRERISSLSSFLSRKELIVNDMET